MVERNFWYDRRHGKTVGAAKTVLETLSSCIPLASVVDVGCGSGTWLSVAKTLGAQRILGFDGPNVPQEYLEVEPSEFQVVNLANIQAGPQEKFDLAISLELAEHLPLASADALVEFLSGLSDHVLFSAAIPGQGGNGHINEQWQDFWIGRFEERGFHCFDFLRPLLWDRGDIPRWYRQNILVFSRDAGFSGKLAEHGYSCLPVSMRRLVHPETFAARMRHAEQPSIRRSAKLLRRALMRRLTARTVSRAQ